MQATDIADAAEDETWPAPRTGWYVAFVLTAANTLAFVDRQALALLVQPIKNDLHVSDTAMSLLYGLSFTLFYIGIGIPVARIADRANRRNIIAWSILLWSFMTAACGLTRSFATLFAARIGVGAGEAGLTPSAFSILTDYFPRHRLAAAMGVYHMGIYLGGAAALLIGGLIASVIPPAGWIVLPALGAVKGWQVIFLMLGLPGVLLCALVFSIREPIRRGTATGEPDVPLRALVAHLARRKRAYAGIGLGFALMILVGNGTGAWIPAFLERRFGWTTADIGSHYGVVVFVCGTTGAVSGGFFASWLSHRRFEQGNLIAALIGFVALVPLTIAFPLMPTATLALTLIGGMNFCASFTFGGGLATLQELTPNRMRALMSACYMLLINIVGATLGPTVVALVTDYGFGEQRYLPQAISLTAAVASPLSVVLLLIGLQGCRAARHREAAM